MISQTGEERKVFGVVFENSVSREIKELYFGAGYYFGFYNF